MLTKNLLAVLLTVIGTTAFANENDASRLTIVPQKGGDAYKLIYQSETPEPVFVSIKDQSGDFILREKFTRTDGFILPVNFRNVKTGTYHVEIKGRKDAVTETISHVSKSDLLKSRVFIQNNNGKMGIVGYDLGASDLYVEIYDSKSNLVYNDRINANGVLNKTFQFEKINSDWVDVEVYHRNDLIAESRVNLK